MKNKFILNTFLALLLVFTAVFTSSASNYVDDINSQTYTDGQHVIYELNIGSYTQDGTLQAAQAKLPELKSLGVDIVWLMPIYPRGGGINSPYAATDFKAVNPSYGTVADLSNYVAAAHALGMQVWLDWVPNHTATNATWVTTHPEYYSTKNGQMVHPNNYGDVYELNYNNQRLVDAMNDCLKYWIDQANVDGYRCDYVSSPTIPASYWQNTIAMLKNYKPGKEITMLAEADFSDRYNARLRSIGFNYYYAWNFQESSLQNGFGSSDNGTTLKNYAQNFVNSARNIGSCPMVYLTSHDQNHNYPKHTLADKYGDNRYLLTVLTYTLYGMPMIFNGEETGGEQDLNYFDDTKINWNLQDSKMKNTLRTLGALKHSQAALHDGDNTADNAAVNFLSTTNNNRYIVAYERTSGESDVIVILNTATTSQNARINGISGNYSQWLNSETISRGIGRKDVSFNGSLSVTIPAKGYVVYVKGHYGDYQEDLPVISDLTDNTENSFFYETDADNASVHAWMWNGSGDGRAYTANGTGWPGDALTEIGKTPQGNYIYKYILTLKEGQALPTNLIITENGSDDAHKTINGAEFVNHGYYIKGNNFSSKTVPTTTGIASVTVSRKTLADDRYFDLSGREVSKTFKGLYIHDGKKIYLD